MSKPKYVSVEEFSSNTYQLFNRVFMVRVRQLDLMDYEHIAKYGVRLSTDEIDDQINLRRLIKVGLTIPKLLEMYRNRMNFYLCNDTDEYMLLSIIGTHIKKWTNYASQHYVNKSIVPYSDLRDLAEMANVIWSVRDRNKGYLKEYSGRDFNDLIVEAFGGVDLRIMLDEDEKKTEDKPEEISDVTKDMQVLNSIFNRYGDY